MHKIRAIFVIHGLPNLITGLTHVVPALEPDEPADFGLQSFQLREIGFQIGQALSHLLHDFMVRRSTRLRLAVGLIGRFAGTGWPEIPIQAMSAPARLDQQNRLVEVIAHLDAKHQLRSKPIGPPGTHTDRQWSLDFFVSFLIRDEHIIADNE